MNIQIYALKKNFDVQKAERYFKERGLKYQYVDLAKHKLGLRELQTFAQRCGLRQIIDSDSKLYREHPIRMLTGEIPILEALMREPHLLRTPIVRNGKEVTVGYCPEVWAKWEEA
ncbi:MAG: arsenate reductase family protein [Christensenellales bacterium]|jgi:arsenate reductase